MARTYIGTSGWNYREWRDGFYKGVAQKDWLPFAADKFDALEVNATFYRQMQPQAYERWARDTPDGFRFCLKGPRYVSHVKRLRDIGDCVIRRREQAAPLKDKVACVSWQCPANFKCDLDRLDGLLSALETWPGMRHAAKFRHTSWFNDRAAARLSASGVAHVLSDAPDWPMWHDADTRIGSDFVYVRLHGHTKTYESRYQNRTLAKWADRIQTWRAHGRDIFVFFDNTMTDAAAKNARSLMTMAGRS